VLIPPRSPNNMAMTRKSPDVVALGVLAKAPVAGLAKTRLIPALGPEKVASLQARLIRQAVQTACLANIGPVTLWVTPDEKHVLFDELRSEFPITLVRQVEGDLGARMLAALTAGCLPAVVIGVDCPVLKPGHLRTAAHALLAGHDVAVIPAEDGGYVLIGSRIPQPELFSTMTWGTSMVMRETRARIARLGLTAWEFEQPLWDVDRPEDLHRLEANMLRI
jgi:uncharacterized protein